MIEELAPSMVALELSDKYGKFAIEPLERGFGHTLGNAFRRILLAHIPGAAITDVRIDGVPHAFTTVDGVYEDATEICLNLKEVAIKLHDESEDEGEIVARIEAEGKGEVVGGDIKCPPGVEIINPEVHIATLTEDDSHLHMELWIERSTGYHPVEEPGREKRAGDVIALDALFSPIARCTYRVEPTRKGARTDLDRLMLEVWGDGTIMPDDAVRRAAEILVRYITIFSEIEMPEEEETEEVAEEEEVRNKILSYPIEEMEFSVRTFNCLKKEDIDNVGQLVERTEEDLLDIRNFGKRSLEEVIEKLAAMDLGLAEAAAAEELVEEEDG
ncbi:MAG: DNA-directed RNA polymerase subunit alpha [candidate division WS1 bacterium]|jgi:DNA-directed RNA polymerase subunit alpha|nr:DNA-directed RNA polymerase subunit alpha [candidate division WS1 bacterium]